MPIVTLLSVQVINAGSSSLKYALYSVERLGVSPVTNSNNNGNVSSCESVGSISRAVQLASGLISEIGGQSVVTHKRPGKENSTLSSVAHMPNHTAALSEMIRHLTDPTGGLVQVRGVPLAWTTPLAFLVVSAHSLLLALMKTSPSP